LSGKTGDADQPEKGRGFRAYWALGALVLGLVAGSLSPRLAPPFHDGVIATAGFVGTLWLNALKMTVIPLVVALLVVGIAKSAEAAQAGRVAARSVLWIVIVCTASAIFGAIAILVLVHLFPLSRSTAAGLQAALGGIESKTPASLPGIAEFFKGVIPDNVVSAAANGDILPLVVFSVLFALALGFISEAGRRSLVTFFEAVGDALLVIIEWVLWVAPIGVFSLALVVGSAAGGSAFGGLAHYIVLISVVGVLVTLAAYPLAMVFGRVGFAQFTRALIPPQAVAISTRSSRERNLSSSRVSATLTPPRRSNSSRKAVARPRVNTFSRKPAPTAPGSCPPCPASITTSGSAGSSGPSIGGSPIGRSGSGKTI